MARTGQHPWLRPGWKILPIRIGCSCSNNKWFDRFRCEDNNVDLMCVQPHCYGVWWMEHSHRTGKEAKHSFWAFELLALCLNYNSNSNNITGTKVNLDLQLDLKSRLDYNKLISRLHCDLKGQVRQRKKVQIPEKKPTWFLCEMNRFSSRLRNSYQSCKDPTLQRIRSKTNLRLMLHYLWGLVDLCKRRRGFKFWLRGANKTPKRPKKLSTFAWISLH